MNQEGRGSTPEEVLDGANLWQQAVEVLHKNDAGGWTKASPHLYPHQWSWDSAFIAMGWAHLDPDRAISELERLFHRQWTTGKLPHIVFDENVPASSYFPDATYWNTAVSPSAPPGAPYTSGICQPPVHALALLRTWQAARRSTGAVDEESIRARLRLLYPAVLSWHRYLAEIRDPEGSGLVSTYHPWEGIDNSPRWDLALRRMDVGELPPFQRADLRHVTDASQRPTDDDYRRYLWLVEIFKSCRYDDIEIQRRSPFLIKDVFMTAVLVAANKALLELGEAVGGANLETATVESWIAAGENGLRQRWDDELELCLDFDLRAAQPIRVHTFAGLAPLVSGKLDRDRRRAVLGQLDSEYFTGNPALRWAVVPSTSPKDPAFQPRKYWRGPTWPIIDWLFWRGLLSNGEIMRAERLRAQVLGQVGQGGFAEYFEPFSGEPLGSAEQSWTAAVTIDWLSAATGAPADPSQPDRA